MAIGSRNGSSVLDEENKEVIRRDLVREQVRQEASALVRRVAEGYSALQNLMEQNPWLAEEMDAEDRQRKRAFDDKLKKGLQKANDAPRCRWVYQGGTTCGSPQMRNHIYCYAHRQMMEAQALALRLPALEDANAIQVGLMRIQKALIDDTISTKKAGLLLYSMQLAITNVGKTTFGQAKDDELVTATVDEQEALNEEIGPSEHRDIGSSEEQRLFTTEGTEGTEEIGTSGHRDIRSSENQNLPRINADERGSERKDMATIVMRPILTRDLELPIRDQTHNASLRDARLPKGPQFASELLDADAGVGSVFQTEPYAKMG